MAAARDQLLDAIRGLMAVQTPPLHALIVPSEDAHQVRCAPLPHPPAQIGGDRISRWGRLLGGLRVSFDRIVPRTD